MKALQAICIVFMVAIVFLMLDKKTAKAKFCDCTIEIVEFDKDQVVYKSQDVILSDNINEDIYKLLLQEKQMCKCWIDGRISSYEQSLSISTFQRNK